MSLAERGVAELDSEDAGLAVGVVEPTPLVVTKCRTRIVDSTDAYASAAESPA